MPRPLSRLRVRAAAASEMRVELSREIAARVRQVLRTSASLRPAHRRPLRCHERGGPFGRAQELPLLWANATMRPGRATAGLALVGSVRPCYLVSHSAHDTSVPRIDTQARRAAAGERVESHGIAQPATGCTVRL